MAINNSPIFSGSPALGFVAIPATATGNTKSDGAGTIGTDIFKAFTADVTNGSYISSIRLSPYATAAGTATTATVIRIFISSQTTGSTAVTNTWLIQEVAAASQTADSSSAATFFLEIPLNRAIPAGYTILVSIHAAPASSTGWQVVVFGGNYTA
jgi:hypothetical protein